MPDTSLEAPSGTPGPSSGSRGGGRGGRGGRGWRGVGGRGGPPSQGPSAPPPADLHQTLAFLGQLASGALPGLSRTAQQQQQQQHLRWGEGDGEAEAGAQPGGLPTDLGVLLWGFFDRFGGSQAGRGCLCWLNCCGAP